MATQEMFDVVDDCSKCKLNTDTYELLQIGTGFWSGDYAMVQKDGVIQKVSLSRVYDVKEQNVKNKL
jgi:peroxiredoxin